MDKNTAIRQLMRLADEAKELINEEAFSERHTRWHLNVLSILDEIFGRNSRYYTSFASISWCVDEDTILEGYDEVISIRTTMAHLNHDAYQKQLRTARGLLLASVDDIERVSNMETLYEGKDTPPESSTIIRIIHLAEQRLRIIIRKTLDSETQLQDAFESLLVGAGIPYSREKDRFEYSSKSYIPDFTFLRLDLAVELKLCNTAEKEKRIIAEINDDIRAYSTKYGNQMFIVYDTGNIRDVDRFKGDLEDIDGVVVIVVKH